MKIAAIIVAIALFGAVGSVEYDPPTENHIWIVRCKGYTAQYEAPVQQSIEKEIAMCRLND